MTMQLCLISCEPTELNDRDNPGQKVTRFKYLFLTEKNDVIVGWSDDRMFEDRLHNSNTYLATRAHAYAVRMDSYAGKLVYKVDLAGEMG